MHERNRDNGWTNETCENFPLKHGSMLPRASMKLGKHENFTKILESASMEQSWIDIVEITKFVTRWKRIHVD